MTNPLVAPTPTSTVSWTFAVPAHQNKKMQLLTIGGICVIGTWYGALGQYFVAHAPLLDVDHTQFQQTLNAYRKQTAT